MCFQQGNLLFQCFLPLMSLHSRTSGLKVWQSFLHSGSKEGFTERQHRGWLWEVWALFLIIKAWKPRPPLDLCKKSTWAMKFWSHNLMHHVVFQLRMHSMQVRIGWQQRARGKKKKPYAILPLVPAKCGDLQECDDPTVQAAQLAWWKHVIVSQAPNSIH